MASSFLVSPCSGRELWRWGRILGCWLGGVTGNVLFIISTCVRLERKKKGRNKEGDRWIFLPMLAGGAGLIVSYTVVRGGICYSS